MVAGNAMPRRVLLSRTACAVATGSKHCIKYGLVAASASVTRPTYFPNKNEFVERHDVLVKDWLMLNCHCCSGD